MRAIRKILGWLSGGALVGVLAGSYVAHRWMPWFNQPGQGQQTICDMKAVTETNISQVFHYQLIGAACGAGVGLIIAIVLGVRASRRAKLAPPAATAPTTTPRV